MTELRAELRGEPPWDDDLPNAVALVECLLGDDQVGAGAILRSMNAGPVAVVLAKVCAALVEAADMPAPWRQFAAWAVRQP